MNEFELIKRFFAPSGANGDRTAGVVAGIGDDAAVLQLPSGCELLAAVDTLVAGRHFPEGTDARVIGHRSLAVNLSDMAAMGATPAWATLALTLPTADADWLQRFSEGLLDLARTHGVSLVGGDTTRGPLTISLQILGFVPQGKSLRRGGASAGDVLVVTGTLGDAGAGLHYLLNPSVARSAAADSVIERFNFPTPRVQFGIAARGLASAAMDLSDGLVGDLPKLADACGLSAWVTVERLPLSAALSAVVNDAQARDLALGAGDDYELLLAVHPAKLAPLRAAAKQLNLTLTAIGELRTGAGVCYILNGRDFIPTVSGYDHFP